MERMRKQGGLLAALAALPEFLLRRRLERSRAEALKALRGEPHQAWRCSRPVEFQYTAATADTLYESL